MRRLKPFTEPQRKNFVDSLRLFLGLALLYHLDCEADMQQRVMSLERRRHLCQDQSSPSQPTSKPTG